MNAERHRIKVCFLKDNGFYLNYQISVEISTVIEFHLKSLRSFVSICNKARVNKGIHFSKINNCHFIGS